MTKERKLAIQMWCMIKRQVRGRTRPMHSLELREIKRVFCEAYNIKWCNTCWFCQYMRNNKPDTLDSNEGCQRCPLADKTDKDVMLGEKTGCAEGIYSDVLHGETVEVRVAACNKIIQALLGKDPYEED